MFRFIILICFISFSLNANDKTARAGYNVVKTNITGNYARMPVIPTINVGNSTSVTGNVSGNDPVQKQVENEIKNNNVYTVDNCMNALLSCINGGAFSNGIRDLFNDDLFISILNGVGVCRNEIDKCLYTKQNNNLIYKNASDVWNDFKSRIILPEYFSFVMKKTGLTPNQAETVCLLLDKNTYGNSFARVVNENTTTNVQHENDSVIASYNSNSVNGKLNPIGTEVNTDMQRGHYSRWDAVNGECLIRVAAYNKDDFITNDWLFGALGDKKPAEVWKKAGDSFVCNKDLFGFSLMNQTSTVAVVGIGGGTIVGGGVGAAVGHGTRGFNCKEKEHRKKLYKELVRDGSTVKIEKYTTFKINESMSVSECEEIQKLYETVSDIASGQIEECDGCYKNLTSSNAITIRDLKCSGGEGDKCISSSELKRQLQEITSVLSNIEIFNGEKSNRWKTTLVGSGIGAGVGGAATLIAAFVEKSHINCRVGDNLEKVSMGKSYKIDSLKDFYVKWNLRIPDRTQSDKSVTNCSSWREACNNIKDLNLCSKTQIQYKRADGIVSLFTPCTVRDNECKINQVVAISNGACQVDNNGNLI